MHSNEPHRNSPLPLYNRDLFLGEVVKLVDQPVELMVGGIDEALKMTLVLIGGSPIMVYITRKRSDISTVTPGIPIRFEASDIAA
jgi:hypothetical protein